MYIEEQSNMYRKNIQIGQLVEVVLKKDQGTDTMVKGKVKSILTSKPFHTRGIKVKLEDGRVGRVQSIL